MDPQISPNRGPRLLGVAVLALTLLIAGMILPGRAGAWLMASAFAVWVAGLAISGSALDPGFKRVSMAIGVFLCAALVPDALELGREPIVVAGLAIILVAIVVADRIWWSRRARHTSSE